MRPAYLCDKPHLGRHERIAVVELDVYLVNAPIIGRVLRARNIARQFLQVITLDLYRDPGRLVPLNFLELFLDPRQTKGKFMS